MTNKPTETSVLEAATETIAKVIWEGWCERMGGPWSGKGGSMAANHCWGAAEEIQRRLAALSDVETGGEREKLAERLRRTCNSAEAFLQYFNPFDMAEDKSQQWQSLHHDIELSRAALQAPVEAAPVGVKVKKLEWTGPIGNVWQAAPYRIRLDDKGTPDLYIVSGWHFGTNPYVTLADAQAAAQAYFERRVLSAIEAKPSPLSRDDVLEEAAKVAEFDAYGQVSYEETPLAIAGLATRKEALNIANRIRALKDKP